MFKQMLQFKKTKKMSANSGGYFFGAHNDPDFKYLFLAEDESFYFPGLCDTSAKTYEKRMFISLVYYGYLLGSGKHEEYKETYGKWTREQMEK